MKVEIHEESIATLMTYATIPIAFEVRGVLEVPDREIDFSRIPLTERPLETPYVKDYDSIKGEGPADWHRRFDISNWGIFAAWMTGIRVGGAAVAIRTPGLNMLEGRDDLAVLWDIRVSPDFRGRGIGSALLRAAESWAKTKGCRHLKIETQNINFPACKFYSREGYILSAVHRFAYSDFPEEVQLLWYKDLP